MWSTFQAEEVSGNMDTVWNNMSIWETINCVKGLSVKYEVECQAGQVARLRDRESLFFLPYTFGLLSMVLWVHRGLMWVLTWQMTSQALGPARYSWGT